MGLEPLLFVIGLVAMAGATLSLLLVLAQRRTPVVASPEAEAESLRVRTVPPGGRIFVGYQRAASPSEGWRAEWSVETDLTWPVYRTWLRERLNDYVCIQSAERLTVIRTIPEQGVRTLSVEPETGPDGCRAQFNFAAISK